MAFGEHSERIVGLALWVGGVSLALTFAMLGGILLIRLIFHRKERRRQWFLAVWRPFFVRGMFKTPKMVPPLRGPEKLYFLILFNQYHSLVKGEEKARLNALADVAGIRRFALDSLKRGDMSRKITAAYALGFMKEPAAFEPLQTEALSENTVLSMAAATAMVCIDAPRAVRILLPMFLSRADWPPSARDRLLREAGKEAVSATLKKAALESDEARAPEIIRLLGSADEETSAEVVRHWLLRGASDETAASCLQMMKDPRLLGAARRYLDHATWYVRLQAVTALGRIGGRGEIGNLARMLADGEWWVRYRAAQAIVGMPGMGKDELNRLRNAQADRFAKDILDHVIAEAGI